MNPPDDDALPPSESPSSTAEPTGYRASYVFLVVVTVINLVADLWSKDWAKSHFESVLPSESRKVEVIAGVMNFIFAKNKGGAWGLLQNETEALRRPFFLVVSVAAIVFIVSLYRKLQPGQTALKWGLPLVLGGALGNLVDRIRYGYVVDFIDVYVTSGGKVSHWPTFNVADISICVGVGLMAIDMFTSRKPETAAPLPPAEPPPSAVPNALPNAIPNAAPEPAVSTDTASNKQEA
jgi:signal peptidase II